MHFLKSKTSSKKKQLGKRQTLGPLLKVKMFMRYIENPTELAKKT